MNVENKIGFGSMLCEGVLKKNKNLREAIDKLPEDIKQQIKGLKKGKFNFYSEQVYIYNFVDFEEDILTLKLPKDATNIEWVKNTLKFNYKNIDYNISNVLNPNTSNSFINYLL